MGNIFEERENGWREGREERFNDNSISRLNKGSIALLPTHYCLFHAHALLYTFQHEFLSFHVLFLSLDLDPPFSLSFPPPPYIHLLFPPNFNG